MRPTYMTPFKNYIKPDSLASVGLRVSGSHDLGEIACNSMIRPGDEAISESHKCMDLSPVDGSSVDFFSFTENALFALHLTVIKLEAISPLALFIHHILSYSPFIVNCTRSHPLAPMAVINRCITALRHLLLRPPASPMPVGSSPPPKQPGGLLLPLHRYLQHPF